MPRGILSVPLIVTNALLALALAEGAARLAERAHPGGDQVSFRYSPYRMLQMDRAPWPLDRDGFRAQELESYRGSFLIEFIGGSVCLGVGDDPGEPIPERIQEALRRAGLARAKVLNLCQGGAASAQELAILVEYGLRLNPDAVLSFDGANDVLHPRPIGEDDAANLPYKNAQLETRVDGGDALSHLALARVAFRLAGHFQAPAPARDEPVAIGTILDSYLYHLGLARTLAQSQHAFYAVLLQPTLHLDKPWSPQELALWSAARPRDGAALTAVIRARYTQTRAALAQWAQAGGTPLYDLTRAFAAVAAPVYSDSVHFRGGLGYATLFEELEEQGLIERLQERYREWEAGL